jgi:hypothetical protein
MRVTDFPALSHEFPLRLDVPGVRHVSVFFAAPAFIAVSSTSRKDAIEIFMFAAVNAKSLLLRDKRAEGVVTAFAIDPSGRTSCSIYAQVQCCNHVCAGTLYSAVSGGCICAWNTGNVASEWAYSHVLQGVQGDVVNLVHLDAKSLCAASSTGYIYRFDTFTRLAVSRWKIGSIVEVVAAGSSLLCLTSSAIVLFKPDSGEGSLSYFEGSSRGRKSLVRAGVGAFYFMSKGQTTSDVGAYAIELKRETSSAGGSAALAQRVSHIVAASSKMKVLGSIQVRSLHFSLFSLILSSFIVLQDPVAKALEYAPKLQFEVNLSL